MADNPPSPFTSSTVLASIKLRQSQRIPPCCVCSSSARCPMAKFGSVRIPQRFSPSSKKTLRCVFCNSGSAIHFCPSGPTYWRSSSQMGQFRGGSFGFGYCVPQVTQMWLISFRPRLVLSAANQSLAGPGSDPATVHAPLFVSQRLNRIEICRAHGWEHPAYHTHQSENGGSDQQYFRRDDQSDVGGFGVFGESAIKGQTSD